ncbi:MAG: hypothetical protein WBA74_26185 [Cyclobacteriaceae bacterium]
MEEEDKEAQSVPDNNTIPKPAKEIEKINAIRDIIFGHDMEEYDSRFNDVKNMINANSEKLSETREEILLKINSIQESFLQNIKDLEHKISAKLDTLEHDKTDRKQLGDLLEEIGKKIKE